MAETLDRERSAATRRRGKRRIPILTAGVVAAVLLVGVPTTLGQQCGWGKSSPTSAAGAYLAAATKDPVSHKVCVLTSVNSTFFEAHEPARPAKAAQVAWSGNSMSSLVFKTDENAWIVPNEGPVYVYNRASGKLVGYVYVAKSTSFLRFGRWAAEAAQYGAVKDAPLADQSIKPGSSSN